jgi:WD40 repeat protein
VWAFCWDGQFHIYDRQTSHYVELLPYSYHSDAISAVDSIYDEQLQCYRVFTSSWDRTTNVWLVNDTKTYPPVS